MLVAVPLLLRKIGEERFGIITIIWLFSGYMGLFDFGLSQATAREIAREKDRSRATIATIFWTAFWSSAVIGLTIFIIFSIFGPSLLKVFFKMASEGNAEIMLLGPWIALVIPLTMVSSVFIGTLEGSNKFVVANAGQILTTILIQIFPTLAAYWLSPDLVWIVPATVVARLISTIVLFALAVGFAVRSRPKFLDLKVARELFSFGSWLFLASILGTVFSAIEKILIASLLGPSSVTQYSIPEGLVRRVLLVPGAFVRSLFYRFSGLDCAAAHSLAVKAIEVLIFLITPIIVIIILSVRTFLDLWVGPELSRVAGPIGTLIALSLWFNSIAFVPDSYLRGRGQARLSAMTSLIEIIPHFAFLFLGLVEFGLIGAAYAVLLGTIVDLALLMWLSNVSVLRSRAFWIGGIFVLGAYATTIFFPTLTLVSAVLYLTQVIVVSVWAVASSPELKLIFVDNLRIQLAKYG